jgi:hypothetical protein
MTDQLPFLDIEDFTAEYQGVLSAGQVTTATRLLQVVSDGIRELKPDVSEAAAQQVTFELVRDDMTFGHLSKLDSFDNVTGQRQESGTLDRSAMGRLLSKRQRQILGLSVATTAAPRGSFKRDDF